MFQIIHFIIVKYLIQIFWGYVTVAFWLLNGKYDSYNRLIPTENIAFV